MNYITDNVLGISVGTRSIGIAVIAEGDLVDWYIKTFRGVWSDQKKLQILDTIEQMLERYDINSFAIKVPDKMNQFPVLTELHSEITQLAEAKSVTTLSFTIKSLKALCGTDVNNKEALRTRVFDLFPELKIEYQKEMENRNLYYTKLFEATLAATALQQHNEKT